MPIELIAILIAGILLLVVLHFLQPKHSGLNQKYYQKKWAEIKTLEHTSAAASRLAIIEADKLLDHALKHRGVKGQTMGDRLKNARNLLGDANAVWTAHKLRNTIAHEDVHPSHAEIRRALSSFEACLKRLGAL